MLINHIHAKAHCVACMDGRFVPGRWYPITDGLMMDEMGTPYEDVRSLEALANLFPNADFDRMVAKVETY